jgi:ornithine carbamoyltransferase
VNAHTGSIKALATPEQAAQGSDAIYTDVWASMGCDSNNDLFQGFQINESLMQVASANAIFMHCLPMVRGQEVSPTLPDQSYSVIYQQSENRLHMQKALLLHLLKKGL